MSKSIESVLKQYFPLCNVKEILIEKIELGICNRTYKIFYREDIFILQKLNPIFHSDIINDIGSISNKLSLSGWSTPKLVKNIKGDNYVLDKEKRLWRLYKYIPGYVINDLKCSYNIYKVGEILARFHNDLSKINYIPTFCIPHFHDVFY